MKQINVFDGIMYGSITPTDIDGFIEYKNKCYVVIETKHEDSEMPYGQRLAIERLIDDLGKVKPAVGIVCSHNSDSDIDVGNAIVTEYRFNHKWRHRESDETTKQFIDKFIGYVEMNEDGKQ